MKERLFYPPSDPRVLQLDILSSSRPSSPTVAPFGIFADFIPVSERQIAGKWCPNLSEQATNGKLKKVESF